MNVHLQIAEHAQNVTVPVSLIHISYIYSARVER